MLKRWFEINKFSFLLLICTCTAVLAEEAETISEPVSLLGRPSLNTSLWQMALGLLLVLGLIFLLTWLMRKVSGIQGTKGHIKVLSAVNVGVKERAVLVEVGGQQLLLGVAVGQVNLLYKLEEPIVDTTPDFSNSLRNATNKLTQKKATTETEL